MSGQIVRWRLGQGEMGDNETPLACNPFLFLHDSSLQKERSFVKLFSSVRSSCPAFLLSSTLAIRSRVV